MTDERGNDGGARTLADLLALHARESPEREAIRNEEGEALTYGVWQAEAERFAARLSDSVRPGDVVGLHFPDAEWLSYAPAYIATTLVGGVAFPLSSLLNDAEAQAQLEEAGARFVVRPTRDSGERSLGVETTGVRTPRALGADVAELIRTSGTTGNPKIVAVPHENLVTRLTGSRHLPAGDRVETFLHALHISTTGGQTPLSASLHATTPVRAVVMAHFEPTRACRLIERDRVTVLSLVPAMGTSLLSAPHADYDLSSVHTLVIGGAPVAPALVEELAKVFPSSNMMISYTTTEALPAAIQMRFDPARPGAVGRPLAASEVSVRGPDRRPVAPGVTGEIVLRSMSVAPRWYLEDRAQSLVTDDGWIRTGDVGYLDEDGYLFITDREKDVIISGGRKISSIEVESALLYHPAVADVAVFGVDDPDLGERVAAALVLSGAGELAGVREFARGRLSGYKLPHHWFVVERIPRNASGKTLKKQLREEFKAAPAQPAAAIAGDVRELEARVARLWGQVLSPDETGLDDDFFEAGGTSITAVALVALLEEEFGVEVDVAALFEHRTVREIAQMLESLGVSRPG